MDAPQTSAFVVTAGERSTFVALTGDFDILTVRAVTSEVDALLATAPTDVVFDMATVEFIDSSGIALLLKIHARVVSEGWRLDQGHECFGRGEAHVRAVRAHRGVRRRIGDVGD